MSKLDYQPLSGEAAHAFPGNSLFLGRNLDQTQERGENRAETLFSLVNVVSVFVTVTLNNFLTINVLFPTKLKKKKR